RIRPGIQVSHYLIGERIGIGGMGMVHRALDSRDNAPVAIKFLISSPEQGQMKIDRFRQEAEIVRRLEHAAIVNVRDIASHDDLHYMVMELFLGPYDKPVNLSDYAARFGAANGRLDEEDTRNIMLVLLDAIAHAHQ